jgi:Pyruvate/2-oxoacid:ferredoxin oxidoreductase delta subunit
MGCYLEDYRDRVGTWAASTSWRTPQGRGSNGQAMNCIECMLLCAAALTIISNRRGGAESWTRCGG